MMQSRDAEGRAEAGLDGDDSLLVEWAAELADRVRAGEVVDLEVLSRRHPERAGALRRLLPAIALLADLGSAARRDPAEPGALPSGLDPGEERGRIGDYRLIREVGRGGMGVVYEAEQISLGRRVALKVLPFAAALDPRQLRRFQVEAQAAAFLHHTHIVPVHAVGCERGIHYFAMQFIEGRSLAELIHELRRAEGLEPEPKLGDGRAPLLSTRLLSQDPGWDETGSASGRRAEESPSASPDPGASPIPPAVAPPEATTPKSGSSIRSRGYFQGMAALGRRAAEALEHAHQQGVLHRDIKPANLMLDGRGHLWITDFGLARFGDDAGLTMTGDVLGTLRYTSPEQALAQRAVIDQRTDVYSLGVTLYELLTLCPAFAGRDRAEVLRRIAEEEPRPVRRLNPAVPVDLETIVRKAMEKDPAVRYATAGALAEDLGRFLHGRPILARPPSVRDRAVKWARRHQAMTVSAGVTMAILLIGTTIASMLVAAKEHQRREAAVAVGGLQSRLRQQAENTAEQARQRQVRQNVEQGTRLMNDGDLAGSLPYFVEALRLDSQDTARGEDHRLRLGMILAQCPKPDRIWFHDQPVDYVLFRPDGRAVAIALRDGTVVVRDVGTGEPLGPILPHGNRIEALDFSPDGRRIATACWDNIVRIREVATGQEVIPPLEHSGQVVLVRFSPDGRLLITGTRPQKADARACRVWDAATGRAVTDWLVGNSVGIARFSPDSRLVALPSGESLQLYDARTGRPAAPSMPHGHSVTLSEHSFSPDSRRIVTGCLDSLVRIWDTTTGQQTAPAMKHTDYAEGASFSPNGRWVLSSSRDRTVRVWDAATGAPRSDPMRHPAAVVQAMFSGDGTRIVTSCNDPAVRVWDAAKGRLFLPPLWHLAPLTATQFSPDGRYVLTASADQTVRLWDLAGASPVGPRMLDRENLYHAQFSPDGRLLVTTGTGGVARVWDARSGSPVGPPLVSTSTWLPAGEFSPDGRMFAAMGGHGDHLTDAWIWDRKTGRVVAGPLAHSFREEAGGTPTAELAWSPDGRLLATAAGSSVWTAPVSTVVRVWEVPTGQPISPVIVYDAAVNSLEFSPDGRSIAIASGSYPDPRRSGEARIIDACTGVPPIPPIVTPQVCQSARFSPDGRRLITESGTAWGEAEARIWDAATGSPLTPPMPHRFAVGGALFSPDGQLAVTTSTDAIRIWNAATGAPVQPPLRFPLPVHSTSLSPDGRRLLTACGSEAIFATDPGFAQVLDLATGWPLTPPLWRERFIQEARFSPDGRRLVTTSWVGGALLWDLESDDRSLVDLIGMAEVLAGTRIGPSGAAVPISTAELEQAYAALRGKFPTAFTASGEQILGWHHQQALACESASAWEAALVHLNHLIEAGPAVAALSLRRGLAHAELGRWPEAARDLDARKLTLQDPFHHWYRAALVHLAGGDHDGYRAACTVMVGHFGGSDASGPPADFTAWTCALGPAALDDLAPALALAERLRAQQPGDAMAAKTLGAVLYRAGRFAESIARLDEAEKLSSDRTSPIYAWLFLTMAHQRLGHSGEARRWLDRAKAAIDQTMGDHARGSETLQFQRRLTLQLLRREAEAAMEAGRPASDTGNGPLQGGAKAK